MSCNLIRKKGLWIIVPFILVLYPIAVSEAQQTLQAELEDGVVLKVHLKQNLGAEGFDYAEEVLQAACDAYKEVTFNQGLNRDGYTFASADRFFAYDSDRVIDINIDNVDVPFALMSPQGGLEYKAEIFVPADYRTYRKRYRISHHQLELKAALTHELLHIIIYSYNRNMQKASQGKVSLTSYRWDWYVEGLARYFETLVGYREEFLSSGFRQKSGKIIKVYKGGVNYFLRYPDKPLNERKYDFALFWQYLHQNYGMHIIEEISCKFRQINPGLCTNHQAMQIIAQTLGVSMESLLQDFSLYLYEVSSVPSKRQNGLRAVNITKFLSCRHKDMSYNISSFGFDFYEIDLRQGLESIQVKALNDWKNLTCVIGVSDSEDLRVLTVQDCNSEGIEIDVATLPKNSKMIIMFSNLTDETILYQISVN